MKKLPDDQKEIRDMVQKKDWDDFQKSGLLLFINQMLHVFGWAIVLKVENNKVAEAYPARVKFRGFDNEVVSESYKKITEGLKENIDELIDDVNE